MCGGVLGEVRKHLHRETPIETVSDLPPPGTPHDLRRHAAGGARLGHDVIGNLPRALEQFGARQHLVDIPYSSAVLASIAWPVSSA
jgi:hypothetical protein